MTVVKSDVALLDGYLENLVNDVNVGGNQNYFDDSDHKVLNIHNPSASKSGLLGRRALLSILKTTRPTCSR